MLCALRSACQTPWSEFQEHVLQLEGEKDPKDGLIREKGCALWCVVFQTRQHKTTQENVHLRFHVAGGANVPNAQELGGAWAIGHSNDQNPFLEP